MSDDAILDALQQSASKNPAPQGSGDPVMDALVRRASAPAQAQPQEPTEPPAWQTKTSQAIHALSAGLPTPEFAEGAAETGLKYGTGLLGTIAGGLRGIAYPATHALGLDPAQNAGQAVTDTQKALTYEPQSQPAQAFGNAISKITRQPKPGEWGYAGTVQGAGDIGNKYLGPVGGAVASALPTAVATMVGGAKTQAEPAVLRPEELPSDVSQYAPGGSAATKLDAQLATASKEMATQVRTEIAQAQLQHGKDWQNNVDFDALNKNLEADSLPVPGRLAAPQASGDPTAISDFMNNRGKDPRVPQFLQWQNKNLADNLAAIREKVGPDVVTTDMPAHGDTLIKAYQDLDAPKVDAIKDAYKSLEDANGGAFPVDAEALAKNVNEALSKKLLSKQDPGGQLSELTDLARRGGMTMENYLSMRKNLGDVARTSADPAARTAASTMIDELEKLPLAPGATQEVKNLADNARNMAKQRFDEIKADPAYKAAVEGSVAPDDFVRKFVINGKRDDIATMAQNLAGNDVARQTMGTAVIDHLRDAARLNPNYEGNFAAASFDKQLQRFTPSAASIFQNGEGSTLQSLANYARNATAQPKGSFINNSNTAVTTGRQEALAKAGNMASTAAEAFAPQPLRGAITLGKAYMKGRAAEQAAEQARQQMEENFRKSMGTGVVK